MTGRRSTRRTRLCAELRAARVVWQREMIHLLRGRTRVALTLLQPLLVLLVLGTGLGTLVPGNYRAFLFPGVLLMTVQTPAIAAGASLVWDREAGFLREMLVAPVHRATLLLGKCAGGATVATCQGVLLLALARTARIPYDPALLAALTAELALASLALTSLTALAAVCITRLHTFQAVLSFALMPMLFLSGAMFPLSGLPHWLLALCLANPLTYALDPLRQAVAHHTPAGGPVLSAWPLGHRPTAAVELAVTALIAVVALTVAARRFARPD